MNLKKAKAYLAGNDENQWVQDLYDEARNMAIQLARIVKPEYTLQITPNMYIEDREGKYLVCLYDKNNDVVPDMRDVQVQDKREAEKLLRGFMKKNRSSTIKALTSDRDLRGLAKAIDAQFQSGGSAPRKSAKVMRVNGVATMVAEVGVDDPFGFNFEWYEKIIKEQIEIMDMPLEGLSAMKPAGKLGDLKLFHWYYV